MSWAQSKWIVDNAGTGIPPANIESFTAAEGDGVIKLNFSPPEDTIIDNQTVCTVGKVMIRKSTEKYPETEFDGELVIELGKDELKKHAVNPLDDSNVKNNTTYYYTAFAGSDHGVYNRVGKTASARPHTYEASIIVTYPRDSTLTCESGSTVLTANDKSGNWTFTVNAPGAWVVRITKDGDESTKTVTINRDGQQERITMAYESAQINVTYPQGAICTATLGSEVLYAPDTSGKCTFTVATRGVWTIKAEQNGQSVEDTADVKIIAEVPPQHTVTLAFFSATITVSYPENSTCTLEGNGKSVSATSNPMLFTVTAKGTYIARAISTSGEREETSKNIEIDRTGQEERVDLSFLTIVTWANGTDEQIAAMIAAADAGKIDLSDYWTVGQERKINISSISPITGVSESQNAQTVTFVLMNKGGKKLKTATPSGRTECSFIVGTKNSLATAGVMNSTRTNAGGWKDAPRRTWNNSSFRNALPSSIRGIFKEYENIQSKGNTTSSQTNTGTDSVYDYFGFAAEVEVFGSRSYCATDEATALAGKQWEWYKTASNRVKTLGDSGSAYNWWERSSGTNGSSAINFCNVSGSGNAGTNGANGAGGIAPVGCI